MSVVKKPQSYEVAFDGIEKLQREYRLDIKALAKTAKEGDLFWAELPLRSMTAGSAPPLNEIFLLALRRNNATIVDLDT